MSYDSPIEIVKKMQEQYETDVVNNVLKCVQSYGINVDKDELIKALKYDRQQYEKGYKDGAKKFVEHFKQILNNEIWECEDEIDCEIHCGSLEPEELEVWKAQRQVDIKRLKWAVENIDFELKLFLEERK